MTRYTKLDKRKAPHKATQYFDDDNDSTAPAQQAVASSSVAAVAMPVEKAASSSPSTSSKKRKVPPTNDKADLDAGKATAEGANEEASSSANDPHRLQKRLKLLRLKAKTAKTDDKRNKLRTEIKQVEALIKEENGKRGGGGASTASTGPKKPARPVAPVVTETNPWKKMEAERRLKSSARNEERREKRAEERAASTRCFACRGMGHAARDCTMGLNAAGTALEGEEGQQAASGSAATLGDESTAAAGAAENKAANLTGKETVGICFRCGSTQHILSRCRRPTPRTGPTLPFATCFVCGQKGHLSSTCSQNAGKGVYPNGGCCKLCQSVEHLAKDCPLRRSEATQASNATMWGGGAGSGWAGSRGGDDDDFHAFARKKAEVEREEKMGGGAAAAGGGHGAKAPGAAPRKKVVSF